MQLFESIQESVAFIRGVTDTKPRIGVILGTGLGGLVGQVNVS